ncbi:MAG: LCP family protein [Candidatus Saccharimonadales bacterium]
MKPQRHSIDGFTPRRAGSQLGNSGPRIGSRPVSRTGGLQPMGSVGLRPASLRDTTLPATLRRSDQGLNQTDEGLSRAPVGLRRSDIDESLNSITPPELPKNRKRRNRKARGAPKSKLRRIIKWVVILLLLLGLSLGGWLAYKTLHAGGNIFKGGIFGLIQSKPLQQDSNGRSNILVLGTSEDDPGHPGGNLTDSMMIVSIDQKGKSTAMFSIPRDLYVKYGMACDAGYAGKINAYFACSNTGTSASDEQDRLTKTKQFVGDIFGMDIQYAVHVNNTVIKQAVDAVGGVDVNIQGDGDVPYGVAPGSILDRNFDWRCGYKCYLVKYSPGVHHLDGEHALFLSMARGDSAPTYGLVNSNFDREKNQQKIIIALKQKAVSTGTLSDIGKVTSLIDALGSNLRTTFDTSEIRTLMQLGADIKPENIASINLYDGANAVVTTGDYGGASVVMPSAGIFDYTQIRQYLDMKLSTNPVTREGANIMVLNGSSVSGVAQTEADKLTKDGFVVGGTDNAPAGSYGDVEIYQIGNGNSATKDALAARFHVTVKTTKPPVLVSGDTKFVIIFGKDPSAR